MYVVVNAEVVGLGPGADFSYDFSCGREIESGQGIPRVSAL
jgi:hypothetical protein